MSTSINFYSTRQHPSSTLFPYTTLFRSSRSRSWCTRAMPTPTSRQCSARWARALRSRSEEHTSELQSQFHLVCRLLLEKKKVTVKGVPLLVLHPILDATIEFWWLGAGGA